jgi:hypothetical protein
MSVHEYVEGDVLELEGTLRGDIGGIPIAKLMGSVAYEQVLGQVFSFRNDEGLLISVGGIRYTNVGVATAWFYSTDRIPKNIKCFNRDVAHMTEKVCSEMNIHRLQCEVMEDKPKWVEWAEMFGFKKEGVMKHYYPDGSNAILMGQIIKRNSK